MAKIAKSRIDKGLKKLKFEDYPLMLSCLATDYGFDKPVISISVMNVLTGKPLEGITKSKIKVTAISDPNGWSLKKKLRVSPVYNRAEGCYTFTISDKGNDLKKGPYTLAIHVKSIVGKMVFRGQNLLQLRVE